MGVAGPEEVRGEPRGEAGEGEPGGGRGALAWDFPAPPPVLKLWDFLMLGLPNTRMLDLHRESATDSA